MMRPSAQAKNHKVFVFGLKGSGKTCLLDQLLYGNRARYTPPTETEGTIEDIYSALIDTDKGTKERIHFLETPGFPSLQSFGTDFVKNYICYADGVVLVYAINNRQSFSIIELVKRAIDRHKEKKEIPIICLGNKMDRFRERQVDLNEAQSWAQKEKIKLCEVTSTERKTLLEPFLYLASKLNPPQNKSTFPRLGPKGKAQSITMEL